MVSPSTPSWRNDMISSRDSFCDVVSSWISRLSWVTSLSRWAIKTEINSCWIWKIYFTVLQATDATIPFTVCGKKTFLKPLCLEVDWLIWQEKYSSWRERVLRKIFLISVVSNWKMLFSYRIVKDWITIRKHSKILLSYIKRIWAN